MTPRTTARPRARKNPDKVRAGKIGGTAGVGAAKARPSHVARAAVLTRYKTTKTHASTASSRKPRPASA